MILGLDCSGVVAKAGKSSGFKNGQHVFGRQTLDRIRETNGTYAEYCVLDSADLCVKPHNLSFEEAAAVPVAALSAFAALCHAGKLTYKNETGARRAVLVLGGSGGVGSFAVQIAKHYLRCHTVSFFLLFFVCGRLVFCDGAAVRCVYVYLSKDIRVCMCVFCVTYP